MKHPTPKAHLRTTLLRDTLTRFSAAHPIEELPAFFRHQFGVNVKQEGSHYLFKYDQLDAKFDKPVTHVCRGTIMLRDKAGVWHYASRPFDKFFNQHQGHCPVFEEEALAEALKDGYLFEKADGTCIQLWFDGTQPGWRASTLGAITPEKVSEEDYTFEDLFWRVSNLHPRDLSTQYTYLFELCTEENRIVTAYDTDHVVFLGARNLSNGRGVDPNKRIQHHLSDEKGHSPRRVRLPAFRFTDTLRTTNLKEVVEEGDGLPGEVPEGVVLYVQDPLDGFKPVAKLKRSAYLALHHAAGDAINSKRKLLAAIANGQLDDIEGQLSDRLKRYAAFALDRFGQYRKLGSLLHTHLATQLEPFTPKTFALEVQNEDVVEIRGFFFRNKKHYLDGDNGEAFSDAFPEAFSRWLIDNYLKLDFTEPKKDDTP